MLKSLHAFLLGICFLIISVVQVNFANTIQTFSLCDSQTKKMTHYHSRSESEPIYPNQKDTLTRTYSDSIDYKNILGRYVCGNADLLDTIVFRLDTVSKASVFMTRSSSEIETYWFTLLSPDKMTAIGVYSPWRIQIVGLRVFANGNIELNYSGSYLFEEGQTLKLEYRKL